MGQPFVVQLPNRPGELAHLARGLCLRGINIIQIQGSAAGDLACALIYTDNDKATSEVLQSMGYSYVAGSTLMVEIEDTPCALADVTTKLAKAGVNLKGCCIVGRREGRADVSLSVDDEAKAREALGLPTLYDLSAVKPAGKAAAKVASKTAKPTARASKPASKAPAKSGARSAAPRRPAN
jgi:hypothetical protein